MGGQAAESSHMLSHIPTQQVAILAGDFLLARASVTLAALRNSETVELMSQVLEHLVSGEIMQVRCHPALHVSDAHGYRHRGMQRACSDKGVKIMQVGPRPGLWRPWYAGPGAFRCRDFRASVMWAFGAS